MIRAIGVTSYKTKIRTLFWPGKSGASPRPKEGDKKGATPLNPSSVMRKTIARWAPGTGSRANLVTKSTCYPWLSASISERY